MDRRAKGWITCGFTGGKSLKIASRDVPRLCGEQNKKYKE